MSLSGGLFRRAGSPSVDAPYRPSAPPSVRLHKASLAPVGHLLAQVVVTRADMSAPTVRPTKARLRRVGAFRLSAATMPAAPPATTPSYTASKQPAGSWPLLVKSPSSGGLIATGPKVAMSRSKHAAG